MAKEIMGFDSQFLKQMKALFQETNIEEIEITEGEDVYFRISRRKQATSVIPQPVQVMPASPVTVTPAVANSSPAPAHVPVQATTTSEYDDETKYYKIKSPIVGTYYASPSPDSPPFVKEGDIVSADTTVAIVEAMKVMNEIKADVKGKIVQILKTHGSPVQAQEPLFIVEKM